MILLLPELKVDWVAGFQSNVGSITSAFNNDDLKTLKTIARWKMK